MRTHTLTSYYHNYTSRLHEVTFPVTIRYLQYIQHNNRAGIYLSTRNNPAQQHPLTQTKPTLIYFNNFKNSNSTLITLPDIGSDAETHE